MNWIIICRKFYVIKGDLLIEFNLIERSRRETTLSCSHITNITASKSSPNLLFLLSSTPNGSFIDWLIIYICRRDCGDGLFRWINGASCSTLLNPRGRDPQTIHLPNSNLLLSWPYNHVWIIFYFTYFVFFKDNKSCWNSSSWPTIGKWIISFLLPIPRLPSIT